MLLHVPTGACIYSSRFLQIFMKAQIEVEMHFNVHVCIQAVHCLQHLYLCMLVYIPLLCCCCVPGWPFALFKREQGRGTGAVTGWSYASVSASSSYSHILLFFSFVLKIASRNRRRLS